MFKRKSAQYPQRDKSEPRVLEKRREWGAFFRRVASDRTFVPPSPLAEQLRAYVPPPGIIGQGQALALDSEQLQSIDALNAWALSSTPLIEQWFADGLGFIGYPQLAQMIQRAEFRKPCTVIAREATREWIRVRSRNASQDGDGPEVKDKIKEIEREMRRLGLRDTIQRLVFQGLAYGMAHCWVDIDGTGIGPMDQNIPLPLTPASVRKGSLRQIKTIEPVWTTPANYNASTPLAANYYKPECWWVQGCLIHKDRLLTFIPFEVSDIFKPSFNFGGMSLTQQLKSYVHNFLRVRNSVANITANFSKLVLQTDMNAYLQSDGGPVGASAISGLAGRATVLRDLSEGQDTIISDKEREDVKIVATPLGGLHELLTKSQEAMASIPGIPLVKFFGIQPTGLNASSEGEIRIFYDEIAAFQEAHLRPILERIFRLIQLSLWGEIDDAIDFNFNPLWQLDEERVVTVEKTKAETDALNIDMGKISAEEARQREETDEASLYRSVDLSSAPPSSPPENFDYNEMPELAHETERA